MLVVQVDNRLVPVPLPGSTTGTATGTATHYYYYSGSTSTSTATWHVRDGTSPSSRDATVMAVTCHLPVTCYSYKLLSYYPASTS